MDGVLDLGKVTDAVAEAVSCQTDVVLGERYVNIGEIFAVFAVIAEEIPALGVAGVGERAVLFHRGGKGVHDRGNGCDHLTDGGVSEDARLFDSVFTARGVLRYNRGVLLKSLHVEERGDRLQILDRLLVVLAKEGLHIALDKRFGVQRGVEHKLTNDRVGQSRGEVGALGLVAHNARETGNAQSLDVACDLS